LERASRYWLCAVVGKRDDQLFCKGMEQLWSWGKQARFMRLFSDGEPRYGSQLWRLAALYLSGLRLPQVFGRRKALPAGIEVAAKVKRAQGRRRVIRRHPEHPYTAISPKADVHANHAEAHNSSIRRRCSAFRRRQNHYAKQPSGLQRAISALRLIHNWSRPHPSLAKGTTPTMAMGYINRPVSIREMLSMRGYQCLLH
jgi:hypothetical protein